jgi:hypothetical protein
MLEAGQKIICISGASKDGAGQLTPITGSASASFTPRTSTSRLLHPHPNK